LSEIAINLIEHFVHTLLNEFFVNSDSLLIPEDLGQDPVLIQIDCYLLRAKEPEECGEVVTDGDCDLRLVVVVLVDVRVLSVELLGQRFMRVRLDTERFVHGQQFKQKSHLSAQLRVLLREVLDIGLPEEPFRVELKELTNLYVFVFVMIYKVFVPYDTL
jgi:hypothetical protein